MSFLEADNFVSGKIKPRNDNVLVRILPPPPEHKASLIVLPDAEYRKVDAARAVVVAVPDKLRSYRRQCEKCLRPHDEYADDLRAGDTVWLNGPDSGDVVHQDTHEYRIVRMAEIEGVEEP
jgi:co-chaperonin GroES (HSP10)